MIAIISDFGNFEYLGIMKGVILSIAKNTNIVDLYNQVNSQEIKEGAWILLNSYKYFPNDTIFLCVVDPGVGTERQAIAIKTKNYFFIGPDNGLMFPASDEDGILSVIKIKEDSNISKTFHGRDLFAKAAANLKNEIFDLGDKTEIKNKSSFYLNGREGEIVRIDNFGNIITNLTSLNKKHYNINNKEIDFYENYEEAHENKLFLIQGSSNTLEISIKNGKAINNFKAKIGDKIEIK